MSESVDTDPKFNVRRMDALGMARQGTQASGEVPLAQLLRFVEGLPEQASGDAGLARWTVSGAVGRGTSKTGGFISDQPLLHLHVQAQPIVVCQRCNESFVYPVDHVVTLQLVDSEEDLDDELADLQSAQDENLDFATELPEKVVGSHRFDLLAQIEDELILSIPYVPRHDVCPRQAAGQATSPEAAGVASAAPVEASGDVKRLSPFAVLEQLKRKN